LKFQIETPSRLHFGLIDLNGELGRINGGLGVALNNPGWKIICETTTDTKNKKLESAYKKRIESLVQLFDKKYNTTSKNVNFQIIQNLPFHVGLGSNTQFTLAIGKLLSKIHSLEISVEDIATSLKRGGTSGIGVAAFEKGGIILDGGHSFGKGKSTEQFLPSRASKAPPAPVIFRNYPPENWTFVICTLKDHRKIFGNKEIKLFMEQCPIPAKEVEKLSRLILMKILPAIVERDLKTFGEGVTQMQTNFPKFGMEHYNEGLVNELLHSLRSMKEVFGSGISSFGPTVFGITNSIDNAKKITVDISENYSMDKFSLLTNSSVNTTGFKIKKEGG